MLELVLEIHGNQIIDLLCVLFQVLLGDNVEARRKSEADVGVVIDSLLRLQVEGTLRGHAGVLQEEIVFVDDQGSLFESLLQLLVLADEFLEFLGANGQYKRVNAPEVLFEFCPQLSLQLLELWYSEKLVVDHLHSYFFLVLF